MNLLFDKKSILDYNLNLFNSYGVFKSYNITHQNSIEQPLGEDNRVKILTPWRSKHNFCTSSQIYYWELFNYSIKECLLFSQTFSNILCKNFKIAENKNIEFAGDKFILNNEIIGINYIFALTPNTHASLIIFKNDELDFENYDFATSFTNLTNYLEVNSILLPIHQSSANSQS